MSQSVSKCIISFDLYIPLAFRLHSITRKEFRKMTEEKIYALLKKEIKIYGHSKYRPGPNNRREKI